MVELTKFMTHPDKPGVVAKMHTKESIVLHAEDGWVLKEDEPTESEIRARWKKKFGKKPHHMKKVSTMLLELEG